mmetsp:Transcript_24852/g.56234  ORF Transcript_24852/g.56234 Transcript_24852/m.56234 type:complete len:272 (-) Transcript_24852:459-1274(-)
MLWETDAGRAGGTFALAPRLGSYSVKLATSSRSTTTISLRTLLSTSLRFTVGTPTKIGYGASRTSRTSLGSTGMYACCQANGKSSAVTTSATMATAATSDEWIRMWCSVSAAARRRVSPSAPRRRQVDATHPPWGRGGRPDGGGTEMRRRSPSRNGTEQLTTPGMGVEALTMRWYRSRCMRPWTRDATLVLLVDEPSVPVSGPVADVPASSAGPLAMAAHILRSISSTTPTMGSVVVMQMPTGTQRRALPPPSFPALPPFWLPAPPMRTWA